MENIDKIDRNIDILIQRAGHIEDMHNIASGDNEPQNPEILLSSDIFFVHILDRF